MQTLEQTAAQKTGSLVQTLCAGFHITRQQAEKHLGVGIVRGHFHPLNSHHADARILELAGDQLRQIPLDLIGDFERPVGRGRFFRHESGSQGLQGTRNFTNLKELQYVTFLDVVVVLDVQAAIETFAHFLGVVLETLERVEFAGVNDGVLTQQT